MSLQDTITQDQADVDAQRTALAVAEAKLAADQAKLQAASSISTLLDQVIQGAESFEQEVKDKLNSLVGSIKALF